jgi:hypothetical protein
MTARPRRPASEHGARWMDATLYALRLGLTREELHALVDLASSEHARRPARIVSQNQTDRSGATP